MATKRGGDASVAAAKENALAIPTYFKAVSGSLGGLVEACCLQPIDVIKTRLQLDHAKAYKGIWHCGTTVVKQEGVRALWKGLTPFATHLTLKYTLRMGSNALLQTAFADPETGKISTVGRAASGFGAGVLEAVAIVTPFEVNDTNLEAPWIIPWFANFVNANAKVFLRYSSALWHLNPRPQPESHGKSEFRKPPKVGIVHLSPTVHSATELYP